MSSILRTLHQMNALVYDSVYGFGLYKKIAIQKLDSYF